MSARLPVREQNREQIVGDAVASQGDGTVGAIKVVGRQGPTSIPKQR